MQRTMIRLGAALAAGFFFLWGVLPYLRPLGRLLPNTKAMVSTTGEILKETEALQAGVAQVQVNLAKVKQQDQLLAQQHELMLQSVAELSRQEELATRSTVLLSQTLEKERTAAGLMAQVSQAAAGSMASVNANAAELKKLSSAAARVEAGSASIDQRLNGMLGELEESKVNFAVLGRLEEAIRRALSNWRWW